jgi:DNA-binding transcriptional ArsR family regulator
MAAEPKSKEHVIHQLEQVRVLAHPIRLRLFEAFARGPKTTKQAAELLGLPPTRLYHHAQALERAGLIRLKETRPNRGTIEKHFEAIAERIALDPDVFRGPLARTLRGKGSALAGRVLDFAKADLLAAMSALDSEAPSGPKAASAGPPPMAIRMSIRTTPQRLAAIHRDLLRWIERQKRAAGGGAEADQADCRDASLTIAFVPAPVSKRAATPPRRVRSPRSRKES